MSRLSLNFSYKSKLKRIEEAQRDFMLDVDHAKDHIARLRSEFETQVRKATHGALRGIVCDVCGLNVYRGENGGGWIHGNGGKAYCADPCWGTVVRGKKK